jgi:hypothetical protein
VFFYYLHYYPPSLKVSNNAHETRSHVSHSFLDTTERSKSNIPCCAHLARQVHEAFASYSRMWRAHPAWIRRESGANVTQMLRAKFAFDVRHHDVSRVHHVNKCCAHLPRPTKDVTFGPLCMWLCKYILNSFLTSNSNYISPVDFPDSNVSADYKIRQPHFSIHINRWSMMYLKVTWTNSALDYDPLVN